MNIYPKIKDFQLDQRITTVMLLTGVEERETRTPGKYFCKFSLTDGERQIEANLWNHTKAEVQVPEKSPITVEIYPKLYQETISYEVYSYGPAPGEANIEDFILSAPYPSEEMYTAILSMLRKEVPANPPQTDLIDLVEQIYAANKTELLRWSAAKAVHHNCYGGLLYHTLRMLKAAVVLKFIYEGSYDREVLLAAVALHDIGKIRELTTDTLGTADYTTDGILYGHTLLGIEMIDRAVADNHGNFPNEKIRLLKHAIAAHHGNLKNSGF